MEILPGIHRIESDLGERFMCQYLLVGEERTVPIDTGLARTPEEVIVPYLEEIGLGVEDVDEVIMGHLDVDHSRRQPGPQRDESFPAVLMRRGRPGMCGEHRADDSGDLPLVRALRLGPDQESKDWIRTELGGDSPG